MSGPPSASTRTRPTSTPILGREVLLEASRHPRVIGLGESGLDYYYDKSDRQVQQALFRMHIGVARETGLPLVVHTRDADEDTGGILADEMGKGAFPALIHCFTASPEFGRRVLDLGLTISISGIVTFKNAARTAGIRCEKFPKTGCWWKPTAPSSPRSRIGARRASRPLYAIPRNSSPTCAAPAWRRWRETTSANFFRLFGKAKPA